MRKLCLLALLLIAISQPAAAQAVKGQKPLGTFGGWHTYVYEEKDNKVCYMVLQTPVTKNLKFKRGAAYLMITHRPAEYTKDVISYTAGFNYKPTSETTVKIGKQDFSLFTAKDTAWSHDAQTDHQIATAIRNGAKATVTGVPLTKAKGVTTVTDNLDLKGAPQAYSTIGKACGYDGDTPAKPKAKATPPAKALPKKKTH